MQRPRAGGSGGRAWPALWSPDREGDDTGLQGPWRAEGGGRPAWTADSGPGSCTDERREWQCPRSPAPRSPPARFTDEGTEANPGLVPGPLGAILARGRPSPQLVLGWKNVGMPHTCLVHSLTPCKHTCVRRRAGRTLGRPRLKAPLENHPMPDPRWRVRLLRRIAAAWSRGQDSLASVSKSEKWACPRRSRRVLGNPLEPRPPSSCQ